MQSLITRPGWFLPERQVTPESVFNNRRQFLKQLGLAGAGLLCGTLAGCDRSESEPFAGSPGTPASLPKGFPAPRNPAYNPSARITSEKVAGTYNNFYEFSLDKNVYKYVGNFSTTPWKIEIGGLVERPMTLDPQELADMFTLEERVFRFRCVEAWSMVVPWTGFPFRQLVEKVGVKSQARFVRFETFNRAEQAPGIRQNPSFPWPYREGLRLDEAVNPLTLLATGIYGKPLPKQHGAPIRLVVPWKYGYKSIKSIVKIEFVANQPSTFWETMAPDEYPFESNVNPKVSHPRWSQATERVLGSGDRVKTLLYNGYGDAVAGLYPRTQA